MKIAIYSLLLLLLLASCETPVELDIPGRPPRLVVNALLVAGQDSTEVYVSLTRPVHGNDPWAVVPGATVRLQEGDGITREAIEHAPGKYRLYHPVKPSTRYRITVEHPAHGTAWGETTVPSPLDATIDTLPAGRLVVNRWRDNPDERNYYWISHMESDTTLPYAIYTASPLVDPFNRDIDPFSPITTCYTGHARVEDSGLAGQVLELRYLYYSRPPAIPFISSVDKHLDAYMKATKLASRLYARMEDLPIFYEPLPSHTNVHDGTGIIGSWVRVVGYR